MEEYAIPLKPIATPRYYCGYSKNAFNQICLYFDVSLSPAMVIDIIAILPVGFRPKQEVSFTSNGFSGGTQYSGGGIVYPDGSIKLQYSNSNPVNIAYAQCNFLTI